MSSENIAIIDLGTNTFHLLLVTINERDEFVVKGKFKEAVKLGEGGINSGRIADVAFERGINALQKFRQVIESFGVVKTTAYATSAIRSAQNGKDFIEAAKETANIHIQTINGNMEASLIFEGVKNGLQLPPDEHHLIIDIGGGSVEFAVAYNGQAQLLRSLNIGAARLLEAVQPSDPIHKKDLDKLHDIFEREVGGLVKELQEFDIQSLVGSSGTFETIAEMVAYLREDYLSTDNLNGYRFTKADFLKINRKLIKANRAERLKMQGMDAIRVDMITLGAALLDYLIKHLPIKKITTSGFALKEGILHQYISDKKAKLNKFMGPVDRSVRAKAVKNLAQKFDYEERHVLHVSQLATRIFDLLKPLHNFSPLEREILQYAAVLHDIGKFVHQSGHHKHGQYIIINSNLSGFSTNELVLLANLVRYHRKALPKKEHFHFRVLPEHEKRMVKILAGILRVAISFNYARRNLITDVEAEISSNQLTLCPIAAQDVSIEIERAMLMKELLEVAVERTVVICEKSSSIDAA